MAWSIINKDVPGKVPVFRTFICDTVDDIGTLPKDVAPGSEAFCVENGNVYVLGVNGIWVEKKSGGGGSGENPNYIETITGTARNIWGPYSYEEIWALVQSGNASYYIDLDWADSSLGFDVLYSFRLYNLNLLHTLFGYATVYESNQTTPDENATPNTAIVTAYLYKTDENYLLGILYHYLDGKRIIIPETATTTLTIIHHPLPENN